MYTYLIQGAANNYSGSYESVYSSSGDDIQYFIDVGGQQGSIGQFTVPLHYTPQHLKRHLQLFFF